MRKLLVMLSIGATIAVPTISRAVRILPRSAGRAYPYRTCYRSLSRWESEKEKEPIEVEIIDNTKKKGTNRVDDSYSRKPKTAEKPTGILGFVQQTAQSAIGGIAKLLGRDEESMKRKQRTAAFNAEIDRALQGSGLVGGLFGRLAKTVGGAMINTIAEGAENMENVRMQVEDLLQADSACRDALGGSVQLYPAMTTSASSVIINGKAQKNVVMVMPVQGARASGQVRVIASGGESSKDMVLDEVVLQLNSGRVIDVPTRKRAGGGKIIDI